MKILLFIRKPQPSSSTNIKHPFIRTDGYNKQLIYISLGGAEQRSNRRNNNKLAWRLPPALHTRSFIR
jgi:hypothetical protein